MVSLEVVTERSVELRFFNRTRKARFLFGSKQLVAITDRGRKEGINCMDSFCHESEKKVQKKVIT